VIIPYCHWSFDHGGLNPEILWCKPAHGPFNKLSLLPVRYSSVLKETFFAQDYHEERFRVFTDHLNLMYVAFTRAMEGLFVFAPSPGKEKLTDAADMLNKILVNKAMDMPPGAAWNDKSLTWTMGDFSFAGRAGIMEKTEQIPVSRICSHEFSGKLRLQYRGTSFFDTEAEQRVRQGNLMHEIFSRIQSNEDVDKAIDAIRREGMIGTSETERLKEEVDRLIGTPGVPDWFDGSWKVITEQDILGPGGSLKRPDRVMLKEDHVVVVDYKFGKQQSGQHRKQVRQYTDMLEKMDYENVTGYIWYVNLKEVVKV
jgi:CRISPR/Cas system-associated exonuclease Cas4 (RecB family)